ncbi:MAG: hypothetical protein KF708_09155 [Pirellulales bacterium]|nr:hypothetical protein [Pirellulales bacterium]
MSYPHAMRLAGPWHYEVLKTYVEGKYQPPATPIGGTAKLPADWSQELGRDFRGRVRYTRSFHRPTNLDPHESVWLVIEGADAAVAVSLNGEPLGEFAGYALTFERDVTNLLAPNNQLQVDVELPVLTPAYERAMRPGRHDLSGGLTGPVRLEVRARHYLHQLMVELVEVDQSEVTLRVAGRVMGPERVDPLLLVVHGWSGELLAAEVVAGQKFDLATTVERLTRFEQESGGPAALTKLSVRLIEGGTRVWEKTLETAHRPMRVEIPASTTGTIHTIVINGEAYELPLNSRDNAFWQALLEQTAPLAPSFDATEPPLFVTEHIFRDEEYARFDRLGVRLVQLLPAAWIDEVSARLAHHPSIVAWAVPRDWLTQGAGVERALGWLAGSSRPWIARELLLGER